MLVFFSLVEVICLVLIFSQRLLNRTVFQFEFENYNTLIEIVLVDLPAIYS